MKVDPFSKDWIAVRAHCDKVLKDHRATIALPGLDPIKTEFSRGMICALNGVLSLATATPVASETDPDED